MRKRGWVAGLAACAVLTAFGVWVRAEAAVDSSAPYYFLASEAKELNNDSRILMRGYITEQLPSGKFVFRDSTGFMRLELDPRDYVPEFDTIVTVMDAEHQTVEEYYFPGGAEEIVNPIARVEIVGTVNRDHDGVVLEAESVRRLE